MPPRSLTDYPVEAACDEEQQRAAAKRAAANADSGGDGADARRRRHLELLLRVRASGLSVWGQIVGAGRQRVMEKAGDVSLDSAARTSIITSTKKLGDAAIAVTTVRAECSGRPRFT